MLLILFSWQFWNIFQFQKYSPIYKSSHSFEVAELRLAPRSSDSNSFPVSKLGVNPPPEDALFPVWCCFPPSRLVKAQGEGRPLDPGGSYLCPHCQSWAAWCCGQLGEGTQALHCLLSSSWEPRRSGSWGVAFQRRTISPQTGGLTNMGLPTFYFTEWGHKKNKNKNKTSVINNQYPLNENIQHHLQKGRT